ncbi:MAG: hypothetical protein MUF81_02120, partial [Verrucomicrobia bacterium]|nr:hypothetical protein [Verrucomicrobiota bacterium]
QELLNISEIENIRKGLVKVQNDFSKDLESARKALRTAEGSVCATLGIPTFEREITLHQVNQKRAVFGKPPITVLHSNEILLWSRASTMPAVRSHFPAEPRLRAAADLGRLVLVTLWLRYEHRLGQVGKSRQEPESTRTENRLCSRNA